MTAMYFLLVILIEIFRVISEAKSSEINYILPNHVVPTHYQISLTLMNALYDGEVAINITVYERSNSITLHIFSLMRISEQDIKLTQNHKEISALYIDFNHKSELLRITLSEEFNPGDYTLKIKYSGQCKDRFGLKFGSYVSEIGETELYWATYFQPTFARRVFPCFDEPQLKATFQLQISHLYPYEAVSNTPIEKIVSNGKIVTTLFKKTPKMSTYILSFEVSKFEAKELFSKDYNKIYRIYTKSNLLNSTGFALNLTKSSVNYFENLLGIDYGLPKLDGVFIPEFPGGMENWGLIVYGDEIFPTEEEGDLQNSIDLICHEVAHQWFGNLVTCNSWDYLWLNEGFASYYATQCAEAIYGNNLTKRFTVSMIFNLISLMDLDCLDEPLSLNYHFENPDDLLDYKFDDITYKKGAVMVRFMSAFVPNYHNLIQKYLKKYSYSSVNSDDLFNSLNENSVLPTHVKNIMHNWVETPGYPLITLNISRNNAGIIVEIEQEKFTVIKNYQSNQKWWIPITLAFESAPDFDNTNVVRWMRDNENKITIEITGKTNDWVIANLQAMVFCRVNYDLDNWNRIIKFLKGPNFEKIHVINRARLLDDAYYFVLTEKLPKTVNLDLLGYLKQETHPLIIELGKQISKIYEDENEVVNSQRQERDTSQVLKKSLKSIEHRHEDNNALYKLSKKLNTSSEDQFKNLEKLIAKFSIPSNSEYNRRIKKKLIKRLKLNEVLKNKFLNGAY